MTIKRVPFMRFTFREGDEAPEGGGCPIGGEFTHLGTQELFGNKKVLVIGLPGAFTPTCSSQQIPEYDARFEEFKALGFDAMYCVSVNDPFVMNLWGKTMQVKNVKMLPDGNAEFTRLIGMLVEKRNLGFGYRSHRYVAVINDMIIEHLFEEDGREDNFGGDPYDLTTVDTVLEALSK
jgi:peroxiredoxin